MKLMARFAGRYGGPHGNGVSPFIWGLIKVWLAVRSTHGSSSLGWQ